jgi:hypothetical protein
LVEQLPRIPVPREIVFQSAEEGTLSCYASRVDDSTGLGSDLADALSTNRLALQLNFPLREFPKDDVKTSQWLISLALTPFLRDSGILGRLVADRPCQACIGERLFVRARDGRSETWPVDELPPSMQNAFDENAGSVAQGDDDELTKVQDSDDVQMTVIGW